MMANDLWRTPPEVFDKLHSEFGFLADMACSFENRLCHIGFDESMDSLSFNWADRCLGLSDNIAAKYVWCNPPYSNITPWVEKAIQAQLDGLGVVMLLNQDTSCGWFYKALQYASEIRYITGSEDENGKFSGGRLAFIGEDGKPVSGNNKPQFILVFNPFKVGVKVTSYVTKKDLYEESAKDKGL